VWRIQQQNKISGRRIQHFTEVFQYLIDTRATGCITQLLRLNRLMNCVNSVEVNLLKAFLKFNLNGKSNVQLLPSLIWFHFAVSYQRRKRRTNFYIRFGAGCSVLYIFCDMFHASGQN
jgi:hypothetical protein